MQTAILFPVALLLIFGIIQGALWFHARHVALGAAQQGARAASAENGAGGEQRAYEFVAGLTGGTLLRDLSVTQTTSGDTVTVTVTGNAPSLAPGVGGIPVAQGASSPIERFIGAGQ